LLPIFTFPLPDRTNNASSTSCLCLSDSLPGPKFTTPRFKFFVSILPCSPNANFTHLSSKFFFFIIFSLFLFARETRAAKTWTAQTSGITNTLIDVFALDSTHVWAVGLSGKILFYNGISWSTQISGTSLHLWGVSGLDSTHVWAVGTSGSRNQGIILFFNGTSWSTQKTISGKNYNSVHALDSTHIYAAGGVYSPEQPYMEMYNGSSWSVISSIPQTDNYLNSVYASDSTHIWGVSDAGYVLFYNGSTWTTIHGDASLNYFEAIDGSSGSNLWLYGLNEDGDYQGYSIFYNGSSWQSDPIGISFSGPGQNVSVLGTSSVWIDGSSALNGGYGASIKYYNGSSWTYQFYATGFSFGGIDMLNAATGWAVGDGGAIYTMVDDTFPPSVSLNVISPNPGGSSPTVTGTATDTAVVSSVEFQVDSTFGSWSACTADDGTFDSPVENFSCAVSSLSGGNHSIYVQATDNSGNVTALLNYGTVSYTNDSAAPSISLTSISSPTKNQNPVLSGVATDAIGTVSSVSFQVDSTSGSWSSCTANDGSFNSASEAFSCSVTSTLTDGNHTIYVRATDSNGNTTSSGSESSSSFTVDTNAPLSFGLVSPDDRTYISNPQPTFCFETTTDATSGMSSFELSIGGISKVSDIKPTCQGGINFSNCHIKTQATSSISPSSTGSYEDNDKRVEYQDKNICVHWKQIDRNLKEGTHYWKVRATDNAGNSRETGQRTLYVDYGYSSVTPTLTPTPTLGLWGGLGSLGNLGNQEENNLKITKVEKQKTTSKAKKNSNLVDVTITVIDDNGVPVEGAEVTLHSTPMTTTTDKQGIAKFTKVEKGNHKIEITYQGNSGSKDITLNEKNITGYKITVQLDTSKSRNLLYNTPFLILLSLVLVVLVLIVGRKYFQAIRER